MYIVYTNIWIQSFHRQCFLLHTRPAHSHRYSLLPFFPLPLFSPHSCSVSVISSPPHPLSPSLASFWSAKQWEIHTPLLPRHHPLSRQGHPWCCRSAYGAAAQQNLFLVRKGGGGLPAATLAAAALGPSGRRGAHDFRNLAAKHADGRRAPNAAFFPGGSVGEDPGAVLDLKEKERCVVLIPSWGNVISTFVVARPLQQWSYWLSFL